MTLRSDQPGDIRDNSKICAKKTQDLAKNTHDPIFLAQTFPAIQILLPGPPPARREVFLCPRRCDSNISLSGDPIFSISLLLFLQVSAKRVITLIQSLNFDAF